MAYEDAYAPGVDVTGLVAFLRDFGELGAFKGKNAVIDLLWPVESEPDWGVFMKAAATANLREAGPRGMTALMLAANNGDQEILGALLPVSDPSAADDQGRTAFMHAARNSHFECLKKLLPVSDAHARAKNGKMASEMLLEVRDGFSNPIAAAMWLHERAPVPAEIWLRLVSLAFGNRQSIPAPVDFPDFLAVAAANCDLNQVRVLAEGLSDWGGGKDTQWPLLGFVASQGHSQFAKMLLELGVNPDGAPGGLCPLVIAARRRSASFVQLLLKHGANPNNKSGMHTALHGIVDPVLGGVSPVACLEILAPISDLSIKDLAGLTALDLAIERKNWEAVEVIGRYLPLQEINRLAVRVAGTLLPGLKPQMEAAAQAVELNADLRSLEASAMDKVDKLAKPTASRRI